MSSLDLHTSAAALVLASARGDLDGVTHLLLDRSHAELIALVAYCARFAATLAIKAHEEPQAHPLEVLERFALVLAAQQPTTRSQ